MSSPDSHAVFLHRLVLHEAGLLTEEGEAELQAHLEVCAACREIRDEHAAEKTGDGGNGHIPSAMLARWDRVSASVRGLERDLLARHLVACEACRRDLELAGYEPVFLDEPEPGPLPQTPAGDAGTTRFLRLDPRARRWAWFQGAAVGAVLAAAAVAVVLRPSPRVVEPQTLPWVVPGATRGSAPQVAVSPGARKVLLAVPTPPVDPGVEVRLSVTGPSGSIIMDLTLAPERLQSPTIMAVLSDPHGLEPGLYSVRLLPKGAAEPKVLSFRLVHTAS